MAAGQVQYLPLWRDVRKNQDIIVATCDQNVMSQSDKILCVVYLSVTQYYTDLSAEAWSEPPPARPPSLPELSVHQYSTVYSTPALYKLLSASHDKS